jgi:hypothetical protein
MVWRIRGKSVPNGTKIVFDTCAAVKLLEGKYSLASLGDDIDEAQQFPIVKNGGILIKGG